MKKLPDKEENDDEISVREGGGGGGGGGRKSLSGKLCIIILQWCLGGGPQWSNNFWDVLYMRKMYIR